MELSGVPNLPCDCNHPFDDHITGICQAEGCDCTEYRPIPRSEARRREFRVGRAESAVAASIANKSERKSQDFPTSPEPGHRFWVDQQGRYTEANLVNAITPFGIVVGEFPVVDNGSKGSNARYMTYRTRTGAENGLARVRLELSEARIVESDGG